jgi:hypothetical protein
MAFHVFTYNPIHTLCIGTSLSLQLCLQLCSSFLQVLQFLPPFYLRCVHGTIQAINQRTLSLWLWYNGSQRCNASNGQARGEEEKESRPFISTYSKQQIFCRKYCVYFVYNSSNSAKYSQCQLQTLQDSEISVWQNDYLMIYLSVTFIALKLVHKVYTCKYVYTYSTMCYYGMACEPNKNNIFSSKLLFVL